MKIFAFVLLAAWVAGAPAHELQQTVTRGSAVVVHLYYADGSPFADQGYELYPGEAKLPFQIGRTDADGSAAFLPGAVSDWRLKTYSEDGHGIDTRFTIAADAAAETACRAADPDRNSRLLLGGALLFGLFGLLQLYLRRSPSR
jgi:nickel transport protein